MYRFWANGFAIIKEKGGRLLGDMRACDTCCHEDSRIGAKVQIGTNAYSVMVIFENGIAMFYVTDEQGCDRTLWYLQTVSHSPEEQTLSCFLSPDVYPVRLQQYKDPSRCGYDC